MKKVWIIMISGLQKKLKKQWMMNPKRFLFYEFEDGKKSKKVLEYILSISIAGKREVETFKREDDSFVCAIMPHNRSTQIRTTPDIVLRMLFVDISCIIYDLYMKLEYLLCSWDPSKRPTAVEALQHPFFQSCYYIPPSLGSKAPTPRMSIPHGIIKDAPTKTWTNEQSHIIPVPPRLYSNSFYCNAIKDGGGVSLIPAGFTRPKHMLHKPRTDKHKDIMKCLKYIYQKTSATLDTTHPIFKKFQSLKVKEFKKDATLKLFKNRYAACRSRSRKSPRWQSYKDGGRELCIGLMISKMLKINNVNTSIRGTNAQYQNVQ
ncbi:cyclin-dependent kinase F-4-like protein isoform X1 [Tanacetum coccineum]